MTGNIKPLSQIREEAQAVEAIIFHTYITLLKMYHVHPQKAYLIHLRIKKILVDAGYMQKVDIKKLRQTLKKGG